ncbi:MAG: DUF3696 domain-containing protein [Nitrospinae bacterium]|nr:DUF3696 domain-containing protein [Nitrospinota bacterium]
MLTSLEIKNFKSWKSTEKIRTAPITGFFGANSSGKTSLIQLLLLLKQTVESSDRLQPLNLGDEKSPVELGTFKDIVHKHSIQEALQWEIAWKPSQPIEPADPAKKETPLFSITELGFRAKVSQRVHQEKSGRVEVNSMSYFFNNHEFGMHPKKEKEGEYDLYNPNSFPFLRTQGRPWPLPPPSKCYGFPDQVRAYFQNAEFLSHLELEFEKLFRNIYYLGPLREYPQRQYSWGGMKPTDMGRRGEKVVDALLASREYGRKISLGKGKKQKTVEEYVAFWLKELGLIHSFKVKPIADDSKLYRVLVKKTPDSAEVLITDVGFGVSQILPVLVLCFYVPEGSTVILEQPEIHLHPSVQAGLADVFIDAIEKRRIQIILESHSEHLLRRLQRRIAEQQLPNDSAALYFCRMDNGESKLSHLDVDMFGTINNWPKDFFGDEFGEMAAITEARMKRQKVS